MRQLARQEETVDGKGWSRGLTKKEQQGQNGQAQPYPGPHYPGKTRIGRGGVEGPGPRRTRGLGG